MAKRFGWPAWAGINKNEPPKSPWGGGPGGDKGEGNKGGGSDGPRNPWTFPPEGKRGRPGGGPGNTLDELLKRARRGGGGGGFPGPGAGSPRLWAYAALGLLLVWVGITMTHPIGQRERGVVTTLGSYTRTLEPGLQFTLPWPINDVEVIDVGNIRTEAVPASGGSAENLMLTGDQNIVDLAYSVRWNISSASDYAFRIADREGTVRQTAEAAMRAVVATASLNDAIGAGRARIEGQVQLLMQQILDEYRSGVRIQGVSIQKAAAPQAVDEAFKLVSAAQQEAQGNKNNANAYAQQVLAAAQGDTAEFDKIYEQYKLAPEVTRRRLYYETMEAVLQRSDKTIIEAPNVNTYLPLPELRKRADAAEAPRAGASR
jgi:membrane protease subunit HflK